MFQEGSIEPLLKDDLQILAYRRHLEDDHVLVLVNFSGNPAKVPAGFVPKWTERLLGNYDPADASGMLRPWELAVMKLEA